MDRGPCAVAVAPRGELPRGRVEPSRPGDEPGELAIALAVAAGESRRARAFGRLLSRDELLGPAWQGVAQGRASFDPGRGGRYAGWAFQCGTWSVRRALRDEAQPRRRLASLDVPDSDGEALADSLPAPVDEEPAHARARREAEALAPLVLSALGERDREVLTMRYYRQMDLAALGAQLGGVSKQAASAAVAAALRRALRVLAVVSHGRPPGTAPDTVLLPQGNRSPSGEASGSERRTRVDSAEG